MKPLYFLIALCCLSQGQLSAQEFSVYGHKPKIDSVWYYNVDKSTKPERMFCTHGGVQNFRLYVSGGSLQSNYVDDVITTNDKEWTEEDIKEAEAKFNEKNQALLEEMLEQENDERIESFEETLEEELVGDCWDAFYDLLNSWDDEDFSLCIDDCVGSAMECEMLTTAERIEGGKVGYRFVHQRSTHAADYDDEAEPPYTVEITYALEYYAEAWVYFRVGCVCLDNPDVMSTTPETPGELATVGVDVIASALDSTEKKAYVCVDVTSPNAVLLDSASALAKVLARLDFDQEIVVLDSADLDSEMPFIKVKILKDGKYVEGWVRRSVVCKEKSKREPVRHSGDIGEGSATKGAKGTVGPDIIDPPWDQIDLTEERMKPGYPFVTPDKTFPWIPVGAGVVGGGTLIYFLTRDDNKPTDCTFTASAITTNSTCGLANGGATINVSPADSYTYVWSNGPTTSSLQNVPAGSYSATVTRVGTTCTRVVNATITNVNPSFTATPIITDAHCGQNDGSAIVNVNPAGFYSITWSNGGSGETQTNLASGSYSVTVSAGGT
ncbi:MAG TPA: SprB repeat-containing protein, partial [Saprospiraceae bacterium]|nr:SprB repeat-containing protein [Saprospiraceae bacterium]